MALVTSAVKGVCPILSPSINTSAPGMSDVNDTFVLVTQDEKTKRTNSTRAIQLFLFIKTPLIIRIAKINYIP